MPSLVTATPDPPSATLPSSSLAAAGAASDATARGERNARRRRRARRGGRAQPATCRAIIVSSEQQLARSLAARARARRGSLSLGFSGAGAMLCCCGAVVASGAGEARDLFGQERWGSVAGVEPQVAPPPPPRAAAGLHGRGLPAAPCCRAPSPGSVPPHSLPLLLSLPWVRPELWLAGGEASAEQGRGGGLERGRGAAAVPSGTTKAWRRP